MFTTLSFERPLSETQIGRALPNGSNPALYAAINDNDFDLDHTVLAAVFSDSIPTQVDIFARP